MTFRSAIYDGEVVHSRRKPKTHRLRYSVFSVLFDLDELPTLDAQLPLFGYNRRAPISFSDADHGPRDSTPLRGWVEEKLREAGIISDGGPVALLCYPRIFGYVFNPLSVYFCYRRDGVLAGVLYEVSNTHGEQHTYTIAVTRDRPDGGVVCQSADKAFFVSPFIGPTATYNFRIIPPADTVSVVIRQDVDRELLLAASFRGVRKALSGASLALRICTFPLMTLKVIAAIHWEAAKLWWKGFEIYPHTPRTRTGS